MPFSRRLFLSSALTGAAAVAAGGVLGLTSTSAQARTLSLQDAQGTVSVPADPKTVAVFNLAVLDDLDALGVPVAGVPSGPKPSYLAKYDQGKTAHIGSLFEPDYEAVNALQPDVILIGGRSASKKADLSALAPTMDLTLDNQHQIASSQAHLKTLGTLFNRQDKAAELIATQNAKLKQVQSLAPKAGKVLFLLTTGGHISTFGMGSRFNMVFEDFGMTPAVENLAKGLHGQAVSFEFILQANPDWLLVLDRDAAIGREGVAAKTLLDNELVQKTTAWSKGQVIYLDAGSWYLSAGGATALTGAMSQVIDALEKA